MLLFSHVVIFDTKDELNTFHLVKQIKDLTTICSADSKEL